MLLIVTSPFYTVATMFAAVTGMVAFAPFFPPAQSATPKEKVQ